MPAGQYGARLEDPASLVECVSEQVSLSPIHPPAGTLIYNLYRFLSGQVSIPEA